MDPIKVHRRLAFLFKNMHFNYHCQFGLMTTVPTKFQWNPKTSLEKRANSSLLQLGATINMHCITNLTDRHITPFVLKNWFVYEIINVFTVSPTTSSKVIIGL